METHRDDSAAGPRPTAGEAAAALQEAEQGRAAVSGIRTPLWYFVALGLWTAPVGPLVSITPDPPAGVAILLAGVAVWAAGLGMLMHVVVKRMRVLVWLDERQMRPLAVIMLPLLIGYALLQSSVDLPWGFEAITVVVAAGIVAFGVHHRLTGGRSS
ncbi:hypothetical protein E1264_15740 [Actinomadura sp. KC216]|uniref:hypothetical protein n=1 Tax=Actinomadura sp. KC216 TaxID=2530370 RepID=UPI00104FDA27|nr:hypothetical protein [Actinomadura sp. KC216]TDB87067.1 hypothetical protein E1264_15740 [Actinomadura sp. KC216]